MLKGKTPKVQSKWNTEFDKDFDWKVLWRNLHNCPAASKIKDLQLKCAHNVIYTEFLLSKMGLSNGKCHVCDHHTETLDQLFFHCVKIQEFFNKVFTYMYQIIPGSHDFEFNIYNVMLGFDIYTQTKVKQHHIFSETLFWKLQNGICG